MVTLGKRWQEPGRKGGAATSPLPFVGATATCSSSSRALSHQHQYTGSHAQTYQLSVHSKLGTIFILHIRVRSSSFPSDILGRCWYSLVLSLRICKDGMVLGFLKRRWSNLVFALGRRKIHPQTVHHMPHKSYHHIRLPRRKIPHVKRNLFQ